MSKKTITQLEEAARAAAARSDAAFAATRGNDDKALFTAYNKAGKAAFKAAMALAAARQAAGSGPAVGVTPVEAAKALEAARQAQRPS